MWNCKTTRKPVLCNGHKTVDSLKFQGVVIQNGLIANVRGSFEWKHHDSAMLQETI